MVTHQGSPFVNTTHTIPLRDVPRSREARLDERRQRARERETDRERAQAVGIVRKHGETRNSWSVENERGGQPRTQGEAVLVVVRLGDVLTKVVPCTAGRDVPPRPVVRV
jgi:hypothetical protein